MRRWLKSLFYRVHEWRDETSQFDPEGHWCGGIECYMRTYRCWLPRWLAKAKVSDYVEQHAEDEKGFWI